MLEAVQATFSWLHETMIEPWRHWAMKLAMYYQAGVCCPPTGWISSHDQHSKRGLPFCVTVTDLLKGSRTHSNFGMLCFVAGQLRTCVTITESSNCSSIELVETDASQDRVSHRCSSPPKPKPPKERPPPPRPKESSDHPPPSPKGPPLKPITGYDWERNDQGTHSVRHSDLRSNNLAVIQNCHQMQKRQPYSQCVYIISIVSNSASLPSCRLRSRIIPNGHARDQDPEL